VRAPDQIHNEWFPVAHTAAVEPGSWHPFELLDERYLLARGNDGEVLVSRDTCPHRGAQLTLGSFDGEQIQCGYHGWRYDMTGRCVHQPAHPDRTPTAPSGLRPIGVQQGYGFWWVCTGDQPRQLPRSAAHAENPDLTIWLEPAVVHTSGPRIIENFLDQAHFPFVHAGYLGQVPNTAVGRYRVEVVDGELRLTDCVFWQPRPGPGITEGGEVAYEYSVSHPYAATLTKMPQESGGGDQAGFTILIVASPITETSCVVWRSTVVRDPDFDPEAQRAFNDLIFNQDKPILESQRPQLLPIDPRQEVHQPADAGSLAYRKWLAARGIRYGTVAKED